ncbi:MAG: PD-(D/E)XK nuclease family protein [Pseudomonadota bacterium]
MVQGAGEIAYNAGVNRYFANFPPAFARVATTHRIVTANERLSREHQRAYEVWQEAEAWPTLNCCSLRQFFRTELRRAQDMGAVQQELLPLAVLRQLAMDLAPRPLTSSREDAVSSSVLTNFIDAWQTIHRYAIDVSAASYAQPRLADFRAWFEAVKATIPDRYVLEEDIPRVLATAASWPHQPVLLDHVDHLSPLEKAYFQAAPMRATWLQRASPDSGLPAWEAQSATPAKQTPRVQQPQLVACDSLRDEVSHAARWAYQVKRKRLDAMIGIVVPDLGQHHAMVQRQCAALFDPLRGSQSQAYDIGAGQSLATHPIWQAARKFLQLCHTGLKLPEFATLTQSRLLQLTDWQVIASRWPREAGARVTLSKLETQLNRSGATPAAVRGSSLLGALQAVQSNQRTSAHAADWVEHCVQLLELGGWPNSQNAQSVRYQAGQAMLEALASLATASPDVALPHMRFAQALQYIDSSLQQIVFAPQRPAADIQILGSLETTGLEFTHLWVCGLDENSFPSPSTSNPFVPQRVARQYAVPRCDAATEYEWARRQFAQWRAQSVNLRLSFTQVSEDSLQQASPLLRHLRASAPGVTTHHPYWQTPKASAFSAPFNDTRGLPFNGTAAPGGASLLQTQADCPFKAYATYRLRLRAPQQANDLPDALQRGVLLHDVLEQLLRQYPDIDALASVTNSNLRALCQTRLQAHQPTLPEAFVATETTRLSELLSRWWQLELTRPPFAAEQLEAAYSVNLNGISLQLRIDRIDRVEDPQGNAYWVVIDYKSGQVSGTQLGDPNIAPQLPLYSLIDARVGAVFFAEIREDKIRLLGTGEPSLEAPDSTYQQMIAPSEVSWDATRSQWEHELNRLAGAFRDGEASVEPTVRACQNCHLHSFCRIAEQR